MNQGTRTSSVSQNNRKWLFRLMGGFVIITGLFFLALYAIFDIWQALLASGIMFVSATLIPISNRFYRRGNELVGGIMIMFGVMIAYGTNELVWSGLLPFHIFGGTLLLLMVASRLLPRAYRTWVILIGIYLVGLFLLNFFEPIPRIGTEDLPILLIYAVATNLALLLIFGSLIIYLTLARAIRTRIMVLTALIVGTSLLISGSISSVITANFSQDQVLTRLEFDRVLASTEIEGLLESYRASLQQVIPLPGGSVRLILNLSMLGPEPDYSTNRTRLDDTLGVLAENSPSIMRIYILNHAGQVVYSTDPVLEGVAKGKEDYYTNGVEGYTTTFLYISPETKEPEFQMAMPVLDENDDPVGVLVADINLSDINQQLLTFSENSQTGEIVLLAENGQLMSTSRFPENHVGDFYALSDYQQQGMTSRESLTGQYPSYRGVDVVGSFEWLQSLGTQLVAEKDQREATAPTTQAVLTNVIVIVAALAASLIAAWFVADRIAKPINTLAQTANSIAGGNLNLIAQVIQNDEVGDLARAFNSMTVQLRAQLTQLEQRVAERTEDLERRSVQLQVAAEVARDASESQDFDVLLQRAVDLVRERFGFYHAGLFLIDETGEYAVLRAATGDAGREMIEQEHKLRIGEGSMVGFAASRGLSRIALDVGEDATHFRNPMLPKTRSEMVLPLKVGDKTIGVLDVQSEEESAFVQDDAVILQTMADQLAVAIDNARLFAEVQASLQQVETLYGNYSQRSWQKLITMQNLLGYQYDPNRGVRELDDSTGTLPKTEPTIIPLNVRGRTVANLKVFPSDEEFSDDQLLILYDLGVRLSQAMESARLYEESQQTAANEQLVSSITSQMRTTLDIDTILQTTIREIRQAFDLSEVEVRLDVGADNNGNGASHSKDQAGETIYQSERPQDDPQSSEQGSA